jgi:serine/threonine-protein kinase OSR1/STK39
MELRDNNYRYVPYSGCQLSTITELATGTTPGHNNRRADVFRRTVLDKAPNLDHTVGGFSKQMKEFVGVCLNKDATLRPSAAKLVEHARMKGAKKPGFLAKSLLSMCHTSNT